MNNYKVFDYLKGDRNNIISNLSINSRVELINYINQYYLELRDNISINKNDTFGFEMEAECFRYEKIYTLMQKYNFDLSKWIIKPDNSLYKGYEVVTPMLNKSNIDWNEIELICEIIKNNSKVGIHAASHIHVGTQVLNNDCETIIKLVLLWSAYENVLTRFAYGEFLNERPHILTYAWPNAESWYKMLKVISNSNLTPIRMLNWLSKNKKEYAVNLCNVKSLNSVSEKNTIEFRLFNYTLNPIIWQNYYNVVRKVFEYCNNPSFNYNIVYERIERNKKYFDDLEYYRKIDLEGSLEFCDLVFDKNIDKIYFLRQYLKNMEETNSKCLKPAKQFTKIPLKV